MNRFITLIIIGLIFQSKSVVKAQTYNAAEKTKGSLEIEGKVIDSNNVGLFCNIKVEFKNGSYKFDALHIFSDSTGIFQIVIKKGVKHKFIIYADNYKPKVITVDTRNGGKNKDGYVFPLEITLRKREKEIEELVPVGLIYYNKQTDLYESKPL